MPCGPLTRKPPRPSPTAEESGRGAPVVSASLTPLVDETMTARRRGSAADDAAGRRTSVPSASAMASLMAARISHACEVAERIL